MIPPCRFLVMVPVLSLVFDFFSFHFYSFLLIYYGATFLFLLRLRPQRRAPPVFFFILVLVSQARPLVRCSFILPAFYAPRPFTSYVFIFTFVSPVYRLPPLLSPRLSRHIGCIKFNTCTMRPSPRLKSPSVVSLSPTVSLLNYMQYVSGFEDILFRYHDRIHFL
ncbi:hypothetical protein GALMADRAFT_465936 [Galerina marginata CBS 339.88]|uniref:Uncharacterized protein n=1 Tax=Galerina marginata (strain CBS 339.88) TaxID=685588 RepID=A0A067TB35_GALM3|nr:hypothetical protein GALMADRAFT_465936 [Galerina marginata CBS 339.88]